MATKFIPGDYPDEPPVVVPKKGDATTSAKVASHNYVEIRVGPYKYITYEEGDKELYVIIRDPAELKNRYGIRRYRKVQKHLEEELSNLRACEGRSCRALAARWPAPPKRF